MKATIFSPLKKELISFKKKRLKNLIEDAILSPLNVACRFSELF